MYPRRRVVVTGLGPIAPNGSGLSEYWASLLEGRSGIGPITLFDAGRHKCQIAGEVKHFDLHRYIVPRQKRNRMSRQTQLALAAVQVALGDAGLNGELKNVNNTVPVVLGISTSAIEILEKALKRLWDKGPTRVSPFYLNSSQPQQAAAAVCEELDIPAQGQTIASACPAGLDAIATAADMITRGRADVAIAGGADAPVNEATFAHFNKSGLLSTRNESPEKASCPFDKGRDSGVVSEGAGVVILEELSFALARGARVYLEIAGFASCMDPTGSEPASGLKQSMQLALDHAGRMPGEIDYLSAHGPGHPVLDRVETQMIKDVFGPHAYRMAISSIKGVTGNPLAAAGPLQLIAVSLAMLNQSIPPTANYQNPDPDCDLDYTPNKARRFRVRKALINNHGIGGGNSSMVVEKVDGS